VVDASFEGEREAARRPHERALPGGSRIPGRESPCRSSVSAVELKRKSASCREGSAPQNGRSANYGLAIAGSPPFTRSFGATLTATRNMRFAMPMFLASVAAAALAGPAHPQDADLVRLYAALAGPVYPQGPDDSLRLYAVHIDRTPKQSWIGNGVYLGGGVVITAAHVAGLGFWRKPRVEIAGQDLPTEVLKDGHFHNVDVTLLSVDARQLPVSLRLRRMPLCQNPPWAGEPVIVAIVESVARSFVLSPALLPPGITAKFQTAISYVAETGNSGSGVFDANKKCLLGIISGNIRLDRTRQENGHEVTERHDVAKYFVPASTIAAFIPSEVRF